MVEIVKIPRQLTLADMEDSEEYGKFVEKFVPKKTTDDCLTPPEIYEVVLDYVVRRYGIERESVIRPFWPGADYAAIEYPDGCVVVDNPPFSILSGIVHTYQTHRVPFFLFAPSLTCLSSRAHVMELNHIICDANITYDNGAIVRTAFITNLDTDGTVLESAPDLGDAINDKMDELLKTNKVCLPKYVYPDHVITAAKVQWFASHHTPYRLNRRDCAPVAKLDAMGGNGIFGGGFLLSERAAAERATAERAAAERAAAERAAAKRWELSDRELAIVAKLGRSGGEL